MPFLILVTLFIGVPILEISLLLKVSGAIGGFKTILFVVFTAILGAYLVKQQGLATLAKFQQQANSGQLPAQAMLEGIALLFAGAVLLTPGFFTDAIGFALLVPLFRQQLISYLVNSGKIVSYGQQANSQSPFHTYSGSPSHSNPNHSNSSVIEGEYTDPADKEK